MAEQFFEAFADLLLLRTKSIQLFMHLGVRRPELRVICLSVRQFFRNRLLLVPKTGNERNRFLDALFETS